MPVEMVTCRNEITGDTAEIPRLSLPYLTAWKPVTEADPVTGQTPDVPGDDVAPPAPPADASPSSSSPQAAPLAAKSRKSKADQADNTKEN